MSTYKMKAVFMIFHVLLLIPMERWLVKLTEFLFTLEAVVSRSVQYFGIFLVTYVMAMSSS